MLEPEHEHTLQNPDPLLHALNAFETKPFLLLVTEERVQLVQLIGQFRPLLGILFHLPQVLLVEHADGEEVELPRRFLAQLCSDVISATERITSLRLAHGSRLRLDANIDRKGRQFIVCIRAFLNAVARYGVVDRQTLIVPLAIV